MCRDRGQCAHRTKLPDRRGGDDYRARRDRRRNHHLGRNRRVRLDREAGRVHERFSRAATSGMAVRRFGDAAFALIRGTHTRARAESAAWGRMTVAAMDINEIMQYLPHRYPFLLVDRVLECVPGESIKAIKNTTINEPFFQGHFPGYPVMPGVMIIEALAQVSVILVYQTLGRRPDGKSLIFFAGIDNARF